MVDGRKVEAAATDGEELGYRSFLEPQQWRVEVAQLQKVAAT